MRYLITGGCGFIGRSLISHLIKDPSCQIRVIDNLKIGSRKDLLSVVNYVESSSSTKLEPWSQSINLLVGDIKEYDDILRVVRGAEVVIHLAANTGVEPSVNNPMGDCYENVIGTLKVLEACRQENVKRFIFASSGAPLGEQDPPLHEKMAPKPFSPYGASKLAGEGYCSAYFHTFGLNTVVLRFGNVYGPRSYQKASVVAKFIKQTLNGEKFQIYGDGLQTRDFIFIDDLVKALQKVSITNNVGGEIFQIASSKETTIIQLLGLLSDKLRDKGIEVDGFSFDSHREGDVKRNFSDASKAYVKLGWKAETPLEIGLDKTLKYFLDKYEKGN